MSAVREGSPDASSGESSSNSVHVYAGDVGAGGTYPGVSRPLSCSRSAPGGVESTIENQYTQDPRNEPPGETPAPCESPSYARIAEPSTSIRREAASATAARASRSAGRGSVPESAPRPRTNAAWISVLMLTLRIPAWTASLS